MVPLTKIHAHPIITQDKYLVDLSKDPEILRIVLYVMRHHVHYHVSSNVQGHACLSQVYNFPTTPTNLPASHFDYILPSLYLTKIVNTSLATTNFYGQKFEVDRHREVLNKANDDMISLFSTMASYACFAGLDSIIET